MFDFDRDSRKAIGTWLQSTGCVGFEKLREGRKREERDDWAGVGDTKQDETPPVRVRDVARGDIMLDAESPHCAADPS